MPESDNDKISISWDELSSPKVNERLSELDEIKSTRSHYEGAKVTAPVVTVPLWRRLLMHSMIYLPLIGMMGGAVGWASVSMVGLRPNLQAQARSMMSDWNAIDRAVAMGRYSQRQAEIARSDLRRAGLSNPFFAIAIDAQQTPGSRADRTKTIRKSQAVSDVRADALFFVVAGTCLGIALASADRLIDRNWTAALVSAACGAVLALPGAIGAAWTGVYLNQIDFPQSLGTLRDAMPRIISWAILGGVLAAAAGLVIGSVKRAALGALGGAVGGVIGAASFDPIEQSGYSSDIARGVGLVLIGGFGGLAMALLESAAKTGWLLVTEGPIAGKQFILYRNPTFIGSAPMSHIYLFRDPRVGRRHAAVHHAPGGFELEDLPLGEKTLVNDSVATRVRLRHSDTIRVGKTLFVFQQKGNT